MLSVSGFPSIFGSDSLVNHGVATSVAASALTIALKDAAGNDPSSASPVRIAFRSTTLTTGTITMVSVTGALSVVISSGSTLGQVSAVSTPIYLYALNNAGVVELAVSTLLFDENQLITTTAEGGAGTADSAVLMYSSSARTGVAFRVIGKLLSNQATAGTWAAVPTNSEIGTVGKLPAYVAPTVQRFTSGTAQTYTTPTSPRIPIYILVKMVGGGGGGAGSGTAPGAATAGNNSTFGTSLLTAAGGAQAVATVPGAGGVVTINAPALTIITTVGGNGCPAAGNLASDSGGNGGSSALGGAGNGGTGGAANAGTNAGGNTGGGGGGGGVGGASTLPGGGGGSGAYLEAILTNPNPTYTYTVGGTANGGTLGTNGAAGGNGAAGQITVIEFYQ